VSSRGDATRALIVTTALKMLKKKGASIRMEDVAHAAGITRQALYLHFKSRTLLMLGILDQVSEDAQAAELFGAVQREKDPLKLVEQMARAAVTYHGRIAAVANALYVARHVDSAAAAAWNQRAAVRRRSIRKVVKTLHRAGLLRPEWSPLDVADALCELVLTPRAYLDLVVERGWSEERLVQATLALARGFFRGEALPA
jgi:AcrR family transcriptional regulator